MVPRGPGMNRYLNRENPNTLVEIIADQQIIGPGEDKGDQRRGEGSEGMGPLKTAAEISGTAAPKINAFLSLSLSPPLFLLEWLYSFTLHTIFIRLHLALCKSLFWLVGALYNSSS
ncbi:hypothetical protein I3843_16G031000 [Carya illinoinensis]|nr:hypothetical protein I3843_16G031000 [Carya illinoinensis]